ncbi:3-oxo-5-alpha-steroid 4-dehydrogenase [Seiridium cupressi]
MGSLEGIVESLDPYLEPARLCQAFFILAACAVLAVAITPPSARGLLTQYGARSSTPPDGTNAQNNASEGQFTRLIGWATSFGQIPHSWFGHFYVLSVLSSAFWAVQYFYHGAFLDAIAKHQTARAPTPSMTVQQVQLAWLLMALQGVRRLYESLFVMCASSSKMWIVHWLLGCAYYLCIGIAVWIEGSIAAPEKQVCNRTVLCGLIFVTVNLGVTASGTRRWYAGKFGEEKIKGKWNMIPFIY